MRLLLAIKSRLVESVRGYHHMVGLELKNCPSIRLCNAVDHQGRL